MEAVYKYLKNSCTRAECESQNMQDLRIQYDY